MAGNESKNSKSKGSNLIANVDMEAALWSTRTIGSQDTSPSLKLNDLLKAMKDREQQQTYPTQPSQTQHKQNQSSYNFNPNQAVTPYADGDSQNNNHFYHQSQVIPPVIQNKDIQPDNNQHMNPPAILHQSTLQTNQQVATNVQEQHQQQQVQLLQPSHNNGLNQDSSRLIDTQRSNQTNSNDKSDQKQDQKLSNRMIEELGQTGDIIQQQCLLQNPEIDPDQYQALHQLVYQKLTMMLNTDQNQQQPKRQVNKKKIQQQPQAPLSKRCELWQLKKERKLKQARDIKQASETIGCTFKPVTNSQFKSICQVNLTRNQNHQVQSQTYLGGGGKVINDSLVNQYMHGDESLQENLNHNDTTTIMNRSKSYAVNFQLATQIRAEQRAQHKQTSQQGFQNKDQQLTRTSTSQEKLNQSKTYVQIYKGNSRQLKKSQSFVHPKPKQSYQQLDNKENWQTLINPQLQQHFQQSDDQQQQQHQPNNYSRMNNQRLNHMSTFDSNTMDPQDQTLVLQRTHQNNPHQILTTDDEDEFAGTLGCPQQQPHIFEDPNFWQAQNNHEQTGTIASSGQHQLMADISQIPNQNSSDSLLLTDDMALQKRQEYPNQQFDQQYQQSKGLNYDLHQQSQVGSLRNILTNSTANRPINYQHIQSTGNLNNYTTARQGLLIREKVEKAKAVLSKVKSRQELAIAIDQVASQNTHHHQDEDELLINV